MHKNPIKQTISVADNFFDDRFKKRMVSNNRINLGYINHVFCYVMFLIWHQVLFLLPLQGEFVLVKSEIH